MPRGDLAALLVGLCTLVYASHARAAPVEVLRLEYQCGSGWHTMRIGAPDCTGVFPILPHDCGVCEVPQGELELGYLPWRQAQKDVPWALVVADARGDRRIPLSGEGCEAIAAIEADLDFYGYGAAQACREGQLAWAYYFWYIADYRHGNSRAFANTLRHLSLAPTLGLPSTP